MSPNYSSTAIVLLLLTIGISCTSYFEISSILNEQNRNINKIINLKNINPDSIGDNIFYLSNFYYKKQDFYQLNNINSFLLLYEDKDDTIARIGIEVRNKKYFEESYTQNKKILVDAKGGMYGVDINGSTILFGNNGFLPDRDKDLNYSTDQTIKSRSITLRFIPEKSISKNWLEVLFWIFFPLVMCLLGLIFLKKAIQQKEF